MKQYIIILGLVAVTLASQGQSDLTLEDCISSAKESSPLALKKVLVTDQSEVQIKLLDRNYLPQSSLNGQASWQSEVTGIPLEFPGVEIPQVPQDQYRLTFDLQQILWDGGKTAAQKTVQLLSAKSQVAGIAVEEYQLEAIIQNLFFGAMLNQERGVALKILSEELESKRERILVSIENGIAIKNDLRFLEVKIAETEQKILETNKAYQGAINTLAHWIGKELDPDITLISPVSSSIDLEKGSNRPELNLFAVKSELLQFNEKMIRIKHRPTISAFGTLGYGQPGLNFLSDGFDSYSMIGGRVHIPLSFLYNRESTLEKQKNKYQIAQNNEDQRLFEQRINAQIIQQQSQIARLQAVIQKDQEIIELRKNIKEVAFSQYENGVITINDYLTEVSNESSAQQNKIVHEIQLLQSEFQLRHILGY